VNIGESNQISACGTHVNRLC